MITCEEFVKMSKILNIKMLAEECDIDYNRLYRISRGLQEFSITEMLKIEKVLREKFLIHIHSVNNN